MLMSQWRLVAESALAMAVSIVIWPEGAGAAAVPDQAAVSPGDSAKTKL